MATAPDVIEARNAFMSLTDSDDCYNFPKFKILADRLNELMATYAAIVPNTRERAIELADILTEAASDLEDTEPLVAGLKSLRAYISREG